jgi:hypothetical protein
MSGQPWTLGRGSPVIVYLQTPKEKVWGVLLSIDAAGVCVRGLDLRIFDEWMLQEARGGEQLLGVSTLFYPMSRLERLELDERVGPVPAYSERFLAEVGRSAVDAVGLGDDPGRGN